MDASWIDARKLSARSLWRVAIARKCLSLLKKRSTRLRGERVLGGVERRRRWSRDEKMRILAESLDPGATAAEVARRNDVAPSFLFAWRRQVRLPAASTTMVPVTITEPSGPVASGPMKPRRTRDPAKERGLIEIDLGGGRRVRVDAGVDAEALARVLDVLQGLRRPVPAGPGDAEAGPARWSSVRSLRGRRGDLIKVIWHDGQGMCLFSKRLERGRFLWPSMADGTVTISSAQLGYLLDGIDLRAPQKTWRPHAAG